MQPPASLKALADPIYEVFYGLTDQPFAITTDPKFFYQSASHQRAYTELLSGLQRYEGMMLLTGETGSGKTTLCRAVLSALGERTFSAMVLNPYMTGAEVYRIILRDFGLVSHEDLRRGAIAQADVPQLLDTVEGFLRSLVPFGGHAVIVLDEAQSLQPEVLDQIRLLTALEQDNRRLVQIVLCGQPPLLETLKGEPMHALNERITRRVSLAPLPVAEVEPYIQHRIAVAGGAAAVSFEPDAAAVVADLSRGLPRRVNVLCDRALQEGRIDGVNVITPELVKRAARSLAGQHDPTPVAPAEPIGSAGMAGLTFGASETASSRSGFFRPVIVTTVAVAAILASVAYGYYAYQAVTGITTLPIPATGPHRDRGPTLPALAAPSEDEFLLMLKTIPDTSPQVPNNSHELD